MNALAPDRAASWSVLDAGWSQAGSNFFLPAPPPVLTAGGSSITGTGLVPLNMNFQGLTSLANRASLYVYGVSFGPVASGVTTDTDYRVQRGEDAAVDDALDIMAAWATITGIDGGQIFWHNYANLNVNSHWQKEIRG